MKILVFSDSHNHAYRIENVLGRETDVDLIIHLGDCVADIQTVQAKVPNIRFEFVSGNCDFDSLIPEEKTFEFAGKIFLITHSSKYYTQLNLNELYRETANSGADIVLFGHTHVPFENTRNGILYLNPGCVSMPKNRGIKTYAVLEITNGNISTQFKEILNSRRQ